MEKIVEISPHDTKVSEDLKQEFAMEVAKFMSSQSEPSSGLFASLEATMNRVLNAFTQIQTPHMTIDGGSESGAFVWNATLKGGNGMTTLTLYSDDKENKQAISTFMKAMNEYAKDEVDNATKEVISAITGLRKGAVSASVDLGTALLDVLMGKSVNAKKVGNAVWTLEKETLLSFLQKGIERSAKRLYPKSSIFDNRADKWARNQKNIFNKVQEAYGMAKNAYDEFSKAKEYSESEKVKLESILNDLKNCIGEISF